MRRAEGDPGRLLDALRSAFDELGNGDRVRRDALERFAAALDNAPRVPREAAASRLPACRHFERAVAVTTSHAGASPQDGAVGTAERVSPAASASVATALAALEPALAWYRRTAADARDAAFRAAHANAFIVGDESVESRAGVAVGVTLLAPGVRYPDHHHPPEELYLVLSPGAWRHGDSGWFEPGIGGIVHNTPGIVHAMRSGGEPLLAIWCLL